MNLEGICYTLPEVQTLLDGVTIGGHKLSDQTITLNQAQAWQHLFQLVLTDQFKLTKSIACLLHTDAAKEDALVWKAFRTSKVTISGTQYIPPQPEMLDALWEQMCIQAAQIPHIYERAIFVFLEMSRTKFFSKMNQHMGRLMMNGVLLEHGYPVINVPASRQREFNTLMLNFYTSHDPQPMIAFMLSCLDPRIIEIMSE